MGSHMFLSGVSSVFCQYSCLWVIHGDSEPTDGEGGFFHADVPSGTLLGSLWWALLVSAAGFAAGSCSRLHFCFLATFCAIPRCHSDQTQINLWSDLSLLKWLHLSAEVLAEHSHSVSSQYCPTLEFVLPPSSKSWQFLSPSLSPGDSHSNWNPLSSSCSFCGFYPALTLSKHFWP